MPEPTMGHDMSRYWRLVNNEGGDIAGTWWVTRPDDKGAQHVKPIDVLMWAEGHHHGFMLKSDDFTAFVTNGKVEPILIRARHEHVQSMAEDRHDEIAAVVAVVAATPEWLDDPRPPQPREALHTPDDRANEEDAK